MNLKRHVSLILNEEKGDLKDFLTTRKEGALKIQQAAEEAGGPSQLTVSHFAAKAKHVVHLFMNGGPSQVDTFDPKPLLKK